MTAGNEPSRTWRDGSLRPASTSRHRVRACLEIFDCVRAAGSCDSLLAVEALFRKAVAALQSGEFATAESQCRELLRFCPAHAPGLHLLGIVQRELGRPLEAERLMRRSIELDPSNPEYRSNLGRLLGGMGRHADGIVELEKALALAPAFRPARLALARLANEAGRFDLAEQHARRLIARDRCDHESWSALGTALYGRHLFAQARLAFETAVRLKPSYGAAHYQLAVVLAEDDHAEMALEHVEHAARFGVAHRELELTRARALMKLDRYAEAECVLDALVQAAPDDVTCQFLLAQLRHVRGDVDFASALRLAAERPGAPQATRAMYADVMRRCGAFDIAERVLRDLIAQHGPSPGLVSSLSTVLHDQGRGVDAVELARHALQARPEDPVIAENFVAAMLSQGDAQEALPVIERFRLAMPLDQRWITYRIDAGRQLREWLADDWGDAERLVQVYDLPPPAGYVDQDEFLGALTVALERRHRQRLHPLDQSMRQGTQTSRGLLVDSDPTIKAFLDALSEPIARYQAAIGHDPDHPLCARNLTPARPIGCWSVRLKRGGFHVNHIHPQGWISSAFYVSVPAEVEDVESRSGWIKFGEPLHPTPECDARRSIQPRPGRLVLFPSYLWHGTRPLLGDAPRLTIAFDAVPVDVATGASL